MRVSLFDIYPEMLSKDSMYIFVRVVLKEDGSTYVGYAEVNLDISSDELFIEDVYVEGYKEGGRQLTSNEHFVLLVAEFIENNFMEQLTKKYLNYFGKDIDKDF